MKNIIGIACLLFLLLPLKAADDSEEMMVTSFFFSNASALTIFKAVEKETKVPIKLQASTEFRKAMPRFNMCFDHIPVSAVLLLICNDAGLEYQVENGTVVFYPEGTLNREKPKTKSRSMGTNMSIGTISYYPVNYRPPQMVVTNGAIVVTGPMPVFQKTYSGIEVNTRASAPRKKIKPPPSHLDDVTMEQELSQMNLVGFSGENMPLDQVLDRLRTESRELTSDQCAVNIYVSAKANTQIQLTFVLNPGNMLDALRTVSAAANLNYRIEKWGVVIY